MPSPYRRPARPPDEPPARPGVRGLVASGYGARSRGDHSRSAPADDGTPAEHPRTDEDQGHDRERDLEFAALHHDAQRHAERDRHQPRPHGAAPRQRRPPESGDDPGHAEGDRERPPHPEEAGDPGVLVVAAPPHQDEHHEHDDVTQQREPGSGEPLAVVVMPPSSPTCVARDEECSARRRRWRRGRACQARGSVPRRVTRWITRCCSP